jgi:hypothetical protein
MNPTTTTTALLVLSLAGPFASATEVVSVFGTTGGPAPPGPPPIPVQQFGFGYAFGDDMVLQREPSMAAVYGFVANGGSAVKVTVSSGGKDLYTVDASLNTTHQAFGGAFGERPCPKEQCPPYDMAGWNPWNQPLATWKALLKPTPAVKGQTFTITAACTGCIGNTTSETITNVVFGDMWYCSGQSNMWLPVDHSLSRNDTVAAIKAGKYTNIHGMFGGSGNHPGGGTFTPGGQGYGRKNGNNPWMTAEQAIATGSSSGSGGSYPLFRMGAACWYGARFSTET